MSAIEHVAGPPERLGEVGRQRCARCGAELLSFVGTLVTIGSKRFVDDEPSFAGGAMMWMEVAGVVVDGPSSAVAEYWTGIPPKLCTPAIDVDDPPPVWKTSPPAIWARATTDEIMRDINSLVGKKPRGPAS